MQRWDKALTWSLITAISEDADVMRGLFPGPGANTSTTNGGGKKKTEFHFMLAVAIFADHEEYGADFARIEQAKSRKQKSALRQTWTGKIKNKLSACVCFSLHVLPPMYECASSLLKETRKHIKTMRDTGEGLTKEELEGLKDTDPDLYNKWGE